MASRKGYQLLQESDGESSNYSISNSEPTTEDKNDNHPLTESCPPVLEPSKDESRRAEGIERHADILRKHFTHSWPPPYTQEISCSESNGLEDEQLSRSYRRNSPHQQMVEPHTTCSTTLLDCYNINVRKIRNSWFIYIFQLLVSILSASAIVMGIIFFRSCEGTYPFTDPALIIIMGTFSLFLIYKWNAKIRRERSGQYYWNRERDRIVIYVSIVLFIMSLELMFFSQISPSNNSTLRSKGEVKCTKTYYDYLYCMHIVNAVCFILAAMVYLPDCCSYIYRWRHLEPAAGNGHYQPY